MQRITVDDAHEWLIVKRGKQTIKLPLVDVEAAIARARAGTVPDATHDCVVWQSHVEAPPPWRIHVDKITINECRGPRDEGTAIIPVFVEPGMLA